MNSLVAVVGSANFDIVAQTARRPQPGETVIGLGLAETPGGKGANQAVAVARAGACAFVGRIGDDPAGSAVAEMLSAAGVNIDFLEIGAEPTGRAIIEVTPDGENSIIVLSLANAALSAATVERALDAIAPALVLTQLEVPDAVVTATAKWCQRREVRFALNLAPARAVADSVLALADPLIVNETEAAFLAPPGAGGWEAVALELAARCRSAVVTLGAAGALVASDRRVERVATPRVTPVDTTGAGDAFAGRLAAALAAGIPLDDAARAACAEAARLIALPRHLR
ncbi:MAG: ribokinase [Bifidobacteriaceae bacterium]|jgi:ribokinase|nr:ribokinase [Bifidobacteriaceae bacterium]